MENNITRSDLDALVSYLSQPEPRLTHGPQVAAFERQWSDWLGVRHSVFLNSGSSANELTLLALRHLRGEGEVIVPPLTWVSDIAAVLHAGLEPVFVDIDPRTLALDPEQVLARITPRTRAVFLTHVLGYNGLTRRLVDGLREAAVPLLEDVCESHGAVFDGRRCGAWGWASNFSFYYAHHLSTIEGGMVCTDDSELYETIRILRSHGMTREASDPAVRAEWSARHPDLTPDFIFAYPAHNMRSTELNAVIGLAQLPRLDGNNRVRTSNLKRFLAGLDARRYVTDYAVEGSSNYALTLLLREKDELLRGRVEAALRAAGVEYRRGMSGGGSQLRQPYLKRLGDRWRPEDFPVVDHVHFFGYYIGNYPGLDPTRIDLLCQLLNSI